MLVGVRICVFTESDGDPNCQDTDGFTDAMGSGCVAWMDKDCLNLRNAGNLYNRFAQTEITINFIKNRKSFYIITFLMINDPMTMFKRI